jgi:hypothetical protein
VRDGWGAKNRPTTFALPLLALMPGAILKVGPVIGDCIQPTFDQPLSIVMTGALWIGL